MKRSVVISIKNVINKTISITIAGIFATGLFYFDVPQITFTNMAKNVIKNNEKNILSSIFSFKLEDNIGIPYIKTIVNAQIEPTPILPKATPKIKEDTKNEEPKEADFSTEKSSVSIENNGIIVTNLAKKNIDIEKLLNKKNKFNLKTGGYKVLVIHSHTTESYYPTDRSQDENKNMIRVGEEFTSILEKNGIRTLHIKTVHDAPYTFSYKNSLKSVTEALEKYKTIEMVIDIHRDAIYSNTNEKLKLVTTLEGKKVAQVMIVSGTDVGGLPHPNWEENLSFALKFQKEMNNSYKGFARPINLRQERFNTHTTKSSLILEIGANGNNLEEAILGAKYSATALAKVIK